MAYYKVTKKQEGGGEETTILDTTQSTNKWNSPLIYNTVNVLNYDYLCFKGTDSNKSCNQYYKIADLPISSNPGSSISDATQFSTDGYLYVDSSGYLYFYISTNRTLVLTEIIVISI